MKKIIALILIASTGFAGQLTYTTAQVESAIGDVGVWLHAGTDRTDYGTDVVSAYSDATSGDTVVIGVGEYDIADLNFTNDNVSIIGSGRGMYDPSVTNTIGGTRLVADSAITVSGNGGYYADFAVKSSAATDLLIASLSTPPSDYTFERVTFIGDTNNTHNAQFSGTNVVVRECESYHSGWFGFVWKGGDNVIFEDCIAGYNDVMQFLIKSSSDSMSVTNAVIRGCTMYCENTSGIVLNAASNGYDIDRVDISGNTIYDASVGIYFQTPNTNSWAKKVAVHDNYALNTGYFIDAHSTGIEDCISSHNVIDITASGYREIASSETNAVDELLVVGDRDIQEYDINSTATGVFHIGDTWKSVASLGATNFTFGLTTTFQTVVPSGGFDDTFAGTPDFTVNTNGTITCNFDGKVKISVQTSFAGGGGSAEFDGNIFLDSTNTFYGYLRNVTGSSNGSAAACHPAMTVADGEVITFKSSVAAGSNTATFHALCICVQRTE